MRLTDRPQTLAAMKPDVAWPADVQSVMDRALERDAKLRYQSAQEFGIALWQAVERMPAKPMVGGATMAGAPAAAGFAQPTVPGTNALEPAAAAIPLSVSAPPAPSSGSQKKLLIGGGVLVAATVASLVLSRMTGGASAPPAVPAPTVVASTTPTPSAPTSSTTQRPLSTPLASMPVDSGTAVETPKATPTAASTTPPSLPPASTPTETAPAPPARRIESSIRSYSSELHRLIETVNDPASARNAASTLRSLRARAHSTGDIAAMDLIEAKIALFTVSGSRGCDMMSRVSSGALDATLRKELEEAVSSCK